MNGDPVISIRDLVVRYDGKPVLNGVSLSVNAGEWVSMLGRSGSGKSSLAHALCGLIDYEGSIRAPSRTSRGGPAVGVVFQSYALYPFMTCRKNIQFGLRHLPRRERRRVADEYLSRVGLSEFGERYPPTLSGGERQRVACARALALSPDVLVLDEPFASIDVLLRDSMADWLKEIVSSTNAAVLFITHSIDEALQLSDRVVVLDRGSLINQTPITRMGRSSADWRVHPDYAHLKERIRSQILGDTPTQAAHRKEI